MVAWCYFGKFLNTSSHYSRTYSISVSGLVAPGSPFLRAILPHVFSRIFLPFLCSCIAPEKYHLCRCSIYGVLVYATLIGWIQKKTSELMRPNYSCWHPLGIACHHFLAPEHDTTDHTRMCPGIADTTHSSSGAV